MIFVCHVPLQDHVIKVLNDFMVKNPSRYITKPPSLLAIGTVDIKAVNRKWMHNSFSLSRDLAGPRDQKAI